MRINWWSMTRLTSLPLLICLTASCGSGNGSGPAPVTEDVTTDIPATTPVHVAFAGGGWRAHTGHAGWTMSLLEDGAYTLDQAFSNVQTLSSNSGGTWFMTMLTYSAAFSASIEAQGAFANYVSPQGYLGQEETLFGDFSSALVGSNWCPFNESEPVFYFYCRLASIAGDAALIWTDIVSNVVFEPFGMNETLETSPTVLSDARQSWAADKSLLIAATMLTHHAVLTESEYLLDKVYYDATLSSGGPEQINVTPVTFASVQAGKTPPPFLSAGAFEVVYTDADTGDSSEATFIRSSVSDSVPVLLATAASSAAMGAAASYSVLLDNGYEPLTWELAYELSDLAVPVTMASPIAGGTPAALTASELADAKFARLGDGGYLDNSAVAQLVSFLQANEQATNFQIVAFDNVQELYTPTDGGTKAGAPIGVDTALLFGQGDQNQVCAGTGTDKFCVSVPVQQVFASDPFGTTTASWQWPSGGFELATLSYTQYTVTTVDNATFGLAAGSKGILHVFTSVSPGADTAPWNGASDFDAYEAMLTAIQTGLQANGKEGLGYLRAALAGTASP